mgnify:CR=1 FL=1
MPFSNYPFGISLTTATGTVSGQLLATTGSFASTVVIGIGSFTGIVTIGSASQLIGGYTLIPVAFAASSALQQIAVTPGVPSCSIDAAYLTFSTVSALVASYTVQVGSAGSVAVATVANTTASVGVVQSLATTATTFDGTASALVCIRSGQGTAGDSILTLVVRRSA